MSKVRLQKLRGIVSQHSASHMVTKIPSEWMNETINYHTLLSTSANGFCLTDLNFDNVTFCLIWPWELELFGKQLCVFQLWTDHQGEKKCCLTCFTWYFWSNASPSAFPWFLCSCSLTVFIIHRQFHQASQNQRMPEPRKGNSKQSEEGEQRYLLDSGRLTGHSLGVVICREREWDWKPTGLVGSGTLKIR